ncbi:MAG: hypothetical protein HY033_10400 [Ignavibacteriae bacterium]|nr:hypothetical protein [Ignavibacteria bacterium]MBI3365307.1 hypothetical protein [Ignavibacteriota bacterium]
MAFKRTPKELMVHATLYWPSELVAREQAASIIPKLISTQDKFISVLHVSDSSPMAWKISLNATKDFSANLFLKHLMVLADVGGEPLQRIGTGFKTIFPKGIMTYIWKEKKFGYPFVSTSNGLRE